MIIFGILVLLPMCVWKFLTLYNGIYPTMIGASISNSLVGLNSFDRLILRLSEIDSYKLVFKYLLLNEKFIVALLIFIFCIYKNFKSNKLLYSFVIPVLYCPIYRLFSNTRRFILASE